MKLFVTGASGFIGSHLVNQAHDRGHTVIGLRRTTDSRSRIPLIREPKWISKDLREVTADEFEQADCIVHLAAHSPNVPYDTLEQCLDGNLLAPLRFFRTAYAAGIARFVVAGSSFEYGRSGERYDFIPTDAPLEPTLTYPASKAAATIAFTAFAAETNARISVHRIFQVYGEGESETRFWPSLRRAAMEGKDFPMTNGEQIRDFIPVELVAAKLLDACVDESVKAGHLAIRNLGTGVPRSLRQFAEECWSQWKATGSLKFGAIPQRSGEVMRFVPAINA